MLKMHTKIFTKLSLVVLLAYPIPQEALANQHSQKGDAKSVRALEMQIQQNLARGAVQNKMLSDQIATLENRIKNLEERAKESEAEIKFLKRLRK